MMDDEYFTTCPYDPCHRVPRSRIQHHLVKCEKKYPKLWICPFNATHRCPDDMKQQHCATCPSRPEDEPNPIAKDVQAGSVVSKIIPKPIQQNEFAPENDPEWD